MFGRQTVDGIHVDGTATVMHGQNRPGAVRYAGFSRDYVDVEGVFLNVTKHGRQAGTQHRNGRRDEGVGGNDNLTPDARSHGSQGDFERGGSAVARYTESGSLEISKLPLERTQVWAGDVTPLTAEHGGRDGVGIGLIRDGPGMK